MTEDKLDRDEESSQLSKSPLHKQLLVMYFVTASDSIALTVIQPFVPGRVSSICVLVGYKINY